MSGIRRWKPFVGLRPRQSPNIPATFMQEHIESDLSPAISEPPLQYTSEISAFAKPEKKEKLLSIEEALFDSANVELQELREAIAQYQIKTDPESLTAASFDNYEWTWEELQDAVKAAARKEGSDDESSSAKASCSKILRNLPSFEAWLELLPGGDYGAVVCGLFKMVVGSAKRANEVRITVFKALADIPECIARAAEYRELYAESRPQELMQKTAQLCSAVLVALRHVIVYFTEGILKGSFKAIVQGPAYKKTLQIHLDAVKELTTSIDLEAIVRSQHRLKDVERYVVGIEKELRGLQAVSRPPMADEVWKQDIITRVGDYCAERVVNSMLSHLSSNSCIGGGMTWSANASRLLESSGSASELESMNRTHLINRESLLSLLGASQEALAREVQLCLAKGGLLEADAQDRVKWIVGSRKLREWLNFAKSKVLLINDNSDEIETFGPTTFLSAKMLESLENIEPIITIHFFCSLHVATNNGVRDDAVGAIESLVVQLMSRSDEWDLTSLDKEDLKRLKAGELETLCGLFRLLVEQLPEMTLLFLVIDGINLYERVRRRQGFLKAMKEVMEIMDDCQQSVIKLLLTCHGRSSFVRDYVDRDDVLTVPFDVDGDGQGWSEQSWKRGVGKDVKELGNR